MTVKTFAACSPVTRELRYEGLTHVRFDVVTSDGSRGGQIFVTLVNMTPGPSLSFPSL